MAVSTLILPSDPLSSKGVDPVFRQIAEVAGHLDFVTGVIDHDALQAGASEHAVLRRLPGGDGNTPVAYFGWMIEASAYERLYAGLCRRGYRPLTSPQAYRTAHHVPDAAEHLKQWSARTVWDLPSCLDDSERLGALLAPFGRAPILVKDWVKSQAAAYFAEACFIPDASDLGTVRRVAGRFIELQGDSLTGGLVFRAYRQLQAASPNGSPEWRGFSICNEPLGPWRRDPSFDGVTPPASLARDIAKALPSPFFSFDLAQTMDGDWLLLEVGDGQVSEIPATAPLEDVLSVLKLALDGLGAAGLTEPPPP